MMCNFAISIFSPSGSHFFSATLPSHSRINLDSLSNHSREIIYFCLALSALLALSLHSLYYFYLACIFFLYSLYCFSKKDTCLLFLPLSVSGATFILYYSFSIHFRDHLATWKRQSAFAFEKGRQAGSLCRTRR